MTIEWSRNSFNGNLTGTAFNDYGDCPDAFVSYCEEEAIKAMNKESKHHHTPARDYEIEYDDDAPFAHITIIY